MVKIGARIARHGRSITFRMAKVMVSRGLFRQPLDDIAGLRPLPVARCQGALPLMADNEVGGSLPPGQLHRPIFCRILKSSRPCMLFFLGYMHDCPSPS
jgi:hypothetical protein